MSGGWVLCVDDDERLLSGLELELGFDHDVATASSGAAGLELLQARPDCAVVISDMRMPSMNGAQFLGRVRQISPDTTRMLLTGYSDLGDTISAVNDGGIFRFLTKPIGPEALGAAVAAGIRQWELLRSERVLLEETLRGAALTLIEALEIAAPETFAPARRIESGSMFVAHALGLDPVWEVALAGLLLRVGWISLPPEVVEEYLKGATLSDGTASMVDEALGTTLRLVGRIPRLGGVADIIAGSVEPDRCGPAAPVSAAAVVRTVADHDDALRLGFSRPEVLAKLERHRPAAIIQALRGWTQGETAATTREITLRQLTIGTVAVRDIITPSGGLLVKSGSELTETLIERLRNFSRSHGVVEPICVASIAASADSDRDLV